MQKLVFALSFFIFAFTSCGSGSQADLHANSIPDAFASTDENYADTIPPVLIATTLGGDTITIEDESKILYAFTSGVKESKSRKLTAKEVRSRFMPMDTACDKKAAWTLQRFFEIDSLKKIGRHPESGFGQPIIVDIRVYDTIKHTAFETWVVWTMWSESEQSCPHSAGTFYMLSTYNASGNLVSTECMGIDVSGGDPPLMWKYVKTTNIFTDGSYRSLHCDTVGDRNYDGTIDYTEIIRTTYTGVINPGGKITSTETEIERMEN